MPERKSSCIAALGVGALPGGPAAAAYGRGANARSAAGAAAAMILRPGAPEEVCWATRDAGAVVAPVHRGRAKRITPPIRRSLACLLMVWIRYADTEDEALRA